MATASLKRLLHGNNISRLSHTRSQTRRRLTHPSWITGHYLSLTHSLHHKLAHIPITHQVAVIDTHHHHHH